MPSLPTISVCLPVFNGEKYLAGAIDSVLNQSFENFELLVVDDCSTDATWEIANQKASADKRIKLLKNERNLGLFANYNRCMFNATGQFIKLFAHDDLFRPSILERMLAVFNETPDVALVAAAKGWIDADGRLIEANSPSELRTMRPFNVDTCLPGDEAICQTLRKMANWLGEPCSQMFRREHVGAGFDSRFKQVGDLDLSYRILQHGNYFFLAETLCYFRKHEVSNTHLFARSLEAWLDWFVIAAKHKEYLPQTGLTADEYSQLLTRRLSGILYDTQYKDKKENRNSIVTSFLGRNKSVLDRFETEGTVPRNDEHEFEAVAVLGMLAVSDLQEEHRFAQNQLDYNQLSIDSLRSEIAETRRTMGHEIAELKSALTDLGNSFSWKLTAPLRHWNKTIQQ